MTNADTVRIAGVSATRPGRVLAIVCAGIVLANLDLFIVNVALPDIARDFGDASLGKLSWILNGYAIVYAALLVFCGRLAERYPRNQSFLTGIALFTVASAACALANSVETLVAFRLVQAAGAALLTPTSLGLILATFPAERVIVFNQGHVIAQGVPGDVVKNDAVIEAYLGRGHRHWRKKE